MHFVQYIWIIAKLKMKDIVLDHKAERDEMYTL